jgi:uncharacterized protein (TIGR04222 family)
MTDFAESPNWDGERRALWSRISAHPFEDPASGLDFARRLARERGWTMAVARGAIEEYRRFCFLAAASAAPVTPSEEVDEVWHLHLAYSRDYWDIWCATILRRKLHHDPTRGGAAELAHFRGQYAATLALYERWFGAPPELFWPATRARFRGKARFRTVDLDRVFVLRRPAMRRREFAVLALALLACALFAARAWAEPLPLPLNPLDWDGASFLVLYGSLLGGSVVVTLTVRLLLRRSGSPADAERLSWFELAYLAGGRVRAFDAAIAELMARQAARFDPTTRSVLASEVSGYLPPFLATIRRNLGPKINHGRLLRESADAFAQVEESLATRGLVLTQGRSWQVGFVTASVPALVGLFGWAKIQVGVSRGRPVGDLVVLTILAFGLALAFLMSRPQRSIAGDEALRAYKATNARAMRAPMDGEIALAVALAGTTVLLGTPFADYARFASSGSGGDGGGDSGGGDSGGGDGGGGDGGGGGCGGCSG